MIRLTEIRHQEQHVILRVEGDLNEEAMALLDSELARYSDAGVAEITLECDGLTGITPRIVDSRWLEALDVSFRTRRTSQVELLTGYGLRVEPQV